MPKIGIIPDIHMRSSHQEKITRTLEQAVEDLREHDIDLLVAPGDIIQHTETAEQDKELLEHTIDILERVECPVQYMAGNHDVMNIEQDDFEDIVGNELWGKRTLDDETLIFLDSSAPWLSGSRGEITEEQLSFLAATLEESDQATIFIHHPIHYHDVSQTYWWSEYPERAFCGNKKEVNRILDQYDNVRGVVNAHLHENDLTRYRGTPHVTVNAFSKETREKPVTGTYALLDLGDMVDLRVMMDGTTHIGYSF